MRKIYVILTGIFFTLLFTTCKQFTADIDDYLSYWSTKAYITDSTIKSVMQNDVDSIPSVPSAEDVSVTLTVKNPKSFPFDLPPEADAAKKVIVFPDLGQAPAAGSDYTISQAEDRQSLVLTYKASFLQAHEWGEQDLSSTLTLYAKDGRVFDNPFTLKIKANTPPPTPTFTVAKTAGASSYYVLCITVPDMDKTVQGGLLHKDLARIEINGTPYAFSVNEGERTFVKPEADVFITQADVERLSGAEGDELPTDSWVLYYKTDAAVQDGAAKKEYTVQLADAKGLVSETVNASTKPNKPKSEGVTVTRGTVTSGTGIETDPTVITTDSTGAEIQVSSGTPNTTVYCTLAGTGGAASTTYNGNPVTVPLPLDGAGTKTYKLAYYTDGEGFTATETQTVYYKVIQGHTVTFDANGGAYPDSSTAVSKNALHGTKVSAPDPRPVKQGFGVTGWYKDAACSAGHAWNFATDTVTGDIRLYAQWTANTYAVTFSVPEGNGSLTATPAGGSESSTGSVQVEHGTQVRFTATPATGYEVDSWSDNVAVTPSTDNKKATLSNVTAPATVTVKFKKKTYTVNYSVVGGTGGTLTATPAGGSENTTGSVQVEHGTKVTFTATPSDATRYKVGDWTCTPSEGFTGGSGHSTATLTVTERTTVTVKFVELTALNVQTLTICGKSPDSAGSVTLPYAVKQVKKDDISLAFSGHTDVPFTVSPATLNLTPGTAQSMTINVAGSEGNYPAWSKTVSITRAKNNVAVLQSFTLNGVAQTAPSGGTFAGEYTVASDKAEVKGFTFSAGSDEATASVEPTGNVTIPVGTGQRFTITVKAQDGTVKQTIEFTVKRQKHAVTFSVAGGTGSLTATPAGGSENTTGSVQVEHGTQVNFTATPSDPTRYKVGDWTCTASEGFTGESGNSTAALTVKANTTVTVKFYQPEITGTAGSTTAWSDFLRMVKDAPAGATLTISGTIQATNDAGNSGEIIIEKNLTIKGKTGAASDILDANSSGTNHPATTHRIFKVENGKTLTLENLTLTGGKAINSDENGNGGGILVKSSTLKMTNCTLKGSTAGTDNTGGSGGGICVLKTGNTASSVTIKGCTIQDNRAENNGGGIYIGGGCTVTLENNDQNEGCTVQGNKARYNGGGVFVDKSTATFTMKGSSVITPSSEVNTPSQKFNDVFLHGESLDSAKITVDSSLSPAGGTAARITPEQYTAGTQVLNGSAVGTEYGKFKVTPKDLGGGITQEGTIDSDGKLKINAKVPYDKWVDYLNEHGSDSGINHIEITGTIPQSGFHSGGWGWQSTGELKEKINAVKPKKIALTLPENLTGITNMEGCFSGCDNLISVENIPAGVANMSACFFACTSLTTVSAIPSTVTDMNDCFYGCKSLAEAPTIPANVQNMHACFSQCEKLVQCPEIPANVTNLSECFGGCKSLTTAPDIPANVTNLSACFAYCSKLEGVKINRNYAGCNFTDTFNQCGALKDGGIKVPSSQLQTYKNNADGMKTTAAKFSGF